MELFIFLILLFLLAAVLGGVFVNAWLWLFLVLVVLVVLVFSTQRSRGPWRW